MTASLEIGRGLAAAGVALPEPVVEQLAAHLALLEKWNRVHNLTAVRDAGQMVALHVLDSLSLLPHLGDAASFLDVGSGAGFPGIPVAIARPHLRVTLLDASHKKATFLEQVRAELGLDNVTVACERVERFHPAAGFDVVASRAFAELGDFVSQAGHLVAPGGRLLAMKGIYPYDEIARMPSSHRVSGVTELSVPNLEAKRHLVVVEPS